MNATPMMMPRTKSAFVPSTEVVYTTTTGDKPRPAHTAAPSAAFEMENDPHCFVCRRHTDHWAEHDALVDAGLASRASDGSVYRTDMWDDAQARVLQYAEYRDIMFAAGLTHLLDTPTSDTTDITIGSN